MAGVEGAAERRPEAQERASPAAPAPRGGERGRRQRPRSRRRPVQPEDPHRRHVQAVEHAGAGGEVVEALGEAEVAGVEEDAEDPGGDAEGGEGLVVAAQRVGGGDPAAHLDEPAVVRGHVAEAEEHGEGLLHAEHPRERPLPVELRHLLPARAPPRRHDPLARVVALLGARPQQEPSVEGCALEGERLHGSALGLPRRDVFVHHGCVSSGRVSVGVGRRSGRHGMAMEGGKGQVEAAYRWASGLGRRNSRARISVQYTRPYRGSWVSVGCVGC